MSWLNGKGTYLSGLAIILAAVGKALTNWSTGEPQDYNETVAQIGIGLGMIRLRRAVADVPKEQ